MQSEFKEKFINKISGIVLTGDMEVNPRILQQLKELQVPTVAIKTDTYTASKQISEIVVKVKPEDKDKIRLIINMIEKYVDFDMILKNLT